MHRRKQQLQESIDEFNKYKEINTKLTQEKDFHNNWYAAFVKTGDEEDVKSRLEYQMGNGFHVYVPKRKIRERKNGAWHDVLHVLFPGYLLINGVIGTDDYYNTKKVPGLWRILKSGNDLLPIPPSEMKVIEKLMYGGEVIGPSDIKELNGQVKVVDGPLSGMEGCIVKIDKRKGRAKIRMNFLGEERAIDLSVNLLLQT